MSKVTRIADRKRKSKERFGKLKKSLVRLNNIDKQTEELITSVKKAKEAGAINRSEYKTVVTKLVTDIYNSANEYFNGNPNAYKQLNLLLGELPKTLKCEPGVFQPIETYKDITYNSVTLEEVMMSYIDQADEEEIYQLLELYFLTLGKLALDIGVLSAMKIKTMIK